MICVYIMIISLAVSIKSNGANSASRAEYIKILLFHVERCNVRGLSYDGRAFLTSLFWTHRREASDIPLIVIGCVQEIEKRGTAMFTYYLSGPQDVRLNSPYSSH